MFLSVEYLSITGYSQHVLRLLNSLLNAELLEDMARLAVFKGSVKRHLKLAISRNILILRLFQFQRSFVTTITGGRSDHDRLDNGGALSLKSFAA